MSTMFWYCASLSFAAHFFLYNENLFDFMTSRPALYASLKYLIEAAAAVFGSKPITRTFVLSPNPVMRLYFATDPANSIASDLNACATILFEYPRFGLVALRFAMARSK